MAPLPTTVLDRSTRRASTPKAPAPPGFVPTFLELLRPDDAAALRAAGTARRFAAGSHLFREGDPGTHALLIERGHVKVVTTSIDGHETVLTIRGAGDLLGEMAAIEDDDRGERCASVVALDAVHTRVLTAAELRELLLARPRIGIDLMRLLTRRLRDSDRRRAEFGSIDLPRRLARLLDELAGTHGRADADGSLLLGVTLSQTELAGLLGSSRESVVRALTALRTRGLVRTARRSIIVIDPGALATFAH